MDICDLSWPLRDMLRENFRIKWHKNAHTDNRLKSDRKQVLPEFGIIYIWKATPLECSTPRDQGKCGSANAQ